MVAVIVCKDDLPHPARVEVVVAHILQYLVKITCQPQAGIDQRQVAAPAVENIDMAV